MERLVTTAGATLGLLFTAVEPVDWRETIRVSQGTGEPETDRIVGRVALTVRAGSTIIGGILVPSGDRTRAVYLFEPGTAAAAASFTLTFTTTAGPTSPPLRCAGPGPRTPSPNGLCVCTTERRGPPIGAARRPPVPGWRRKTQKPGDFTQLLTDVASRVFDIYPDSTVIYPGHGDDTTLGTERAHLSEWRARGW